MTGRADRAARAARRERRQEAQPQGVFVDVVDELLGDGGAANALPPPIIPVVQTAESSLDLPPNWHTGEMPQLQAGVAGNLPPLPSSLGSVSGRRSAASGHSPGGRPSVPQPRGRGTPGMGLEEAESPEEGPCLGDLPETDLREQTDYLLGM